MKSRTDLLSLIPRLSELLPEADAVSAEEPCFSGWAEFYADGWEVAFRVSLESEWEYEHGDYDSPDDYRLRRLEADIEEFSASHTDILTGEESEFSEQDLEEARGMLIGEFDY